MLITVNENDFSELISEKKTVKQFFEEKDSFFLHAFSYQVDDSNGDGQNELSSYGVARWSANPHFWLGKYNTFYQYENHELKPIKVIFPKYSD